MLIEFSTIVNVDHPNIVKIRDVYEDHQNFYVVSDFIPQGNLFQFLAQKKSLSE
jgi:serine/threonine-protein kinase HSL1 (negative regulator of Swe1 kinase)